MKFGIAGRLALWFVNSKLTPLVIIASLLLGGLAVFKTPREEEPQIIVPMADVIVRMSGSTSKEVEQRVVSPLEKLIWEVPGVEYVYSTSNPGQALIVVRFLVGQDQERAMVRLRDKIAAHTTDLPPGATPPTIQSRSIDDVPILALTFHSQKVDSASLRQVVLRVEQQLKAVPDVSETSVIGGSRREVQVTADPAKLAGSQIGLDQLLVSLSQANVQAQSGTLTAGQGDIAIRAGNPLSSANQLANQVVARRDGKPVYLQDVAHVKDGPGQPTSYVFFGSGPGGSGQFEPAVTLSISKRGGTNAIAVANAVLEKLSSLKGVLIPADINVEMTRNYGRTSAEKSNELLMHMGIAVISVTVLIAIALGRKESLVVLVAIPVTLALTLFVFYLNGFTLNRITLFALIFSIGILVDDAIVVVENIVRHLRMPGSDQVGVLQTAVKAVDEVGNPTILATFAVIAAILPMAFVGGLMGPYMRPIPVGASAAMLFSLLIAFVVTPWAAIRILKGSSAEGHASEESMPDDMLTRLYRRIMTPLLRSGKLRGLFFGGVLLLLIGSMALVGLKAVTVKMLPFDNKNEFQIIVDMPTGTTLEDTNVATQAIARYISTVPEVVNYQTYVGTSSPYNFNGLVRHYFLRSQGHQADIQVNLLDKGERKAQSHAIVKRIRDDLSKIASKYGARIKVAEVPPGPPVLETLVAEVYGPDAQARLQTAKQIKDVFSKTEGVTDVDWYVDDEQATQSLVVDQQKAAISGVTSSSLTNATQTMLSGTSVGLLHDEDAREDVPIIVRLPRERISGHAAVDELSVTSATGQVIPLSSLASWRESPTDKSIYHKNLLPVTYVVGDVVGRQESPVYAILKMNKAIASLSLPKPLTVLTTQLPSNTNDASMKWDGEWHITYEVFRDLGVAFAAVLILIYVLVVAWFQDFKVPMVIMTPIPLTLIGILPAHALMGAFFTATSMIGFIAGAGIIVRNSIILVDFIELRRQHGASLEDAVVEAGAIRFRPMLLTASAVIVGSLVILFDPIFQGLAVALMAGEIASTLISRFAVPVLYFMAKRKNGLPDPSANQKQSPATEP